MKLFLTSLLLSAAFAAAAQSTPALISSCDDGNYVGASGRPRACETRDLTLAAVKNGKLTVDGNRNGGIVVKGYSGADIKVRAKVQAWARTEAEAKSRLAGVKISTDNNALRSLGPDESEQSGGGYSVSYELLVPEKQALDLTTHNGGIHLENLRGEVTFTAQNGGVSVAGSGGNIKGRTQNGGLNIALSGSKWDGAGLDVATTNGGIRWEVPADYSAQLFTSTVHGPIRTDLPSKVQGNISGREVSVALGKGGAPVRAVTTNGGVTVSRRGQ